MIIWQDPFQANRVSSSLDSDTDCLYGSRWQSAGSIMQNEWLGSERNAPLYRTGGNTGTLFGAELPPESRTRHIDDSIPTAPEPDSSSCKEPYSSSSHFALPLPTPLHMTQPSTLRVRANMAVRKFASKATKSKWLESSEKNGGTSIIASANARKGCARVAAVATAGPTKAQQAEERSFLPFFPFLSYCLSSPKTEIAPRQNSIGRSPVHAPKKLRVRFHFQPESDISKRKSGQGVRCKQILRVSDELWWSKTELRAIYEREKMTAKKLLQNVPIFHFALEQLVLQSYAWNCEKGEIRQDDEALFSNEMALHIICDQFERGLEGSVIKALKLGNRHGFDMSRQTSLKRLLETQNMLKSLPFCFVEEQWQMIALNLSEVSSINANFARLMALGDSKVVSDENATNDFVVGQCAAMSPTSTVDRTTLYIKSLQKTLLLSERFLL